MFAAGRQRPGAMAAVLGLADRGGGRGVQRGSGPTASRWPANLNAPDQTVISGDPAGVTRAGEGCKARGAKRVIPLKVSGAFHSPLMAPAVDGLHDALAGATFRRSRLSRSSPTRAREPVRTGVDAKRLLVDQLTAPVRWVDVHAARRRARARTPRFIEVGPGQRARGSAQAHRAGGGDGHARHRGRSGEVRLQ